MEKLVEEGNQLDSELESVNKRAEDRRQRVLVVRFAFFFE